MSTKDGGAAFPREFSKSGPYTDSPTYGAQSGMSLRDYFAAKAMQATLSNESANERLKWICETEGNDPFDIAARGAYMMADAMLAARSA